MLFGAAWAMVIDPAASNSSSRPVAHARMIAMA
jgi:hypothetical protein